MLSETNLLDLLKNKGLNFQIYKHPPLYTVEDSERLRGKIGGAHTKNLFLKNKKDEFFLFSCEENVQVDLKISQNQLVLKIYLLQMKYILKNI